ALVVGGILLLHEAARGEPSPFPVLVWILLVSGGLLVLSAFMLDFRIALRPMEPPPFRWGLFGTGVSFGVAAVGLALRKRS
ncbi:MAG: hypothetical protein ACJ8DJ_22885, partial [Gemmatimonadales bacterium]